MGLLPRTQQEFCRFCVALMAERENNGASDGPDKCVVNASSVTPFGIGKQKTHCLRLRLKIVTPKSSVL